MSNDNATLTACREALAAMEQAEAAMTQGPWELLDGEDCMEVHGPLPMLSTICILPETDTVQPRHNAAGIALLRNAAPGTLRGWRKLLDMCEAAMLSDADMRIHKAQASRGYRLSRVRASVRAIARHDFALAILAALADAMGVTGGGNG